MQRFLLDSISSFATKQEATTYPQSWLHFVPASQVHNSGAKILCSPVMMTAFPCSLVCMMPQSLPQHWSPTALVPQKCPWSMWVTPGRRVSHLAWRFSFQECFSSSMSPQLHLSLHISFRVSSVQEWLLLPLRYIRAGVQWDPLLGCSSGVWWSPTLISEVVRPGCDPHGAAHGPSPHTAPAAESLLCMPHTSDKYFKWD